MLQMLHYQILITLYYLFLTRRVTWGEVHPAFFQRKCPDLGEKMP